MNPPSTLAIPWHKEKVSDDLSRTAYSCEHGPLDDLDAYHQVLDSAYKGLKSAKLVRKS